MTQQDIVNELNRIVVGYNINWDSIKYDADKAIMKINAHLGAEYPMMSAIMLSPDHRYTIKYKNTDVPIFPERYILTVVIPYIATEILARDEEFTTIYNKYAVDAENGLFDMFQNEFNKVPPVFRQDSDIGVFFSPDIKQRSIHKQRDTTLPDFKFNVYYHFNFDNYLPDNKFTLDVNKYPYGTKVVVKDTTVKDFIINTDYYEFAGWSTTPLGVVEYNVGDTLEGIKCDLHLYAVWNKQSVLNITPEGEISIKDSLKSRIVSLDIPVYVDGIRVYSIAENFDSGTQLVYAKLPRTNLTIKTNAFTSNSLKSLILPSYDYIRDYPTYGNLLSSCINTTSLEYLYIPISITTANPASIIGVSTIALEYDVIPDGFYQTDNVVMNWAILSESATTLPNIKVGVVNG